MAQFVCTRCGKCCMSLGRHIRIERSLSSVRHYCRIAVTGELLPVTVSPQHRDLFSTGERDPSWCPFLRIEAEDRYTCTVHETLPRLCREFRCRTMQIYDREGRVAGYVKGRRSLSAEDRNLASLWSEIPANTDDDDIKAILKRHGYRAEPLE